ncbi:hypothetical protein [Novosphingobium sp. MBES04]|uniref:hypothetical protein n=1 Tax=Novosphingobium sp. MBES04 TaxID=1206458 RepID=UPI0005808A75|nr:hypothetical protein [Novosphingobium sp. MBES04]
MRTRPGICQRKKRFVNEEEALRVAEKAPFPLRPYRCELCGNIHLTGRTKGMKLPAFELARRRAAKAAREDAAR